MKPSNSDKILPPSSLPSQILMVDGPADSSNLQPTFYKLATKPYKYKKVSHTSSTNLTKNLGSHLSGMEEKKDLLYREQAYSAKPTATCSRSDAQLSRSSLANSTLDNTSNELSSIEDTNKTLIPFMKSLLGEKAFNSISLMSVSFFISGMLLMFYFTNLI